MPRLPLSFALGALTSLTLPLAAGAAERIRNFNQVDARIYRGAQPTEEGFRYLATLGVETVLDLRESGGRSRAEEKAVRAAGMKYINVPIAGLRPPTRSETDMILGILENANGGPIFVHCKRGADRTGAVIAAYRIDHDRWNNARALSEAKLHGMAVFQIPRENFIRNFRARTAQAKASVQDAGTPPLQDSATLQPILSMK